MVELQRELAARAGHGSLEGLKAGLDLVADEAAVVRLIDALLEPRSAERAARLARSSYLHAFGFAKLVLLEQPGAFKLRLHDWPRGADESDIHDHRWSFGSKVLRGGYHFEEYALARGDAWHCYRYLPTRGRGHFELEGLGTRDVQLMRRGRVSEGAVYCLGSQTPHRVRAHASEPTLSLVLQGPDVKESTVVLTKSARVAQPAAKIEVERLDGARYRRCLERIRRRLS